MSRPDWDRTWLAVANAVACRSLCTRAQVGAVIVSERNRIVATGYNGPPAGFMHHELPCNHWCMRSELGPTPESMTSYEDCPALHAELNALSVCDRSAREGGRIYVTGDMCYNCAKVVANSGLGEVIVQVAEDNSYRQPQRSYEFLERCGLTVVTYAIG